jgi:predicted ATP-grasp superfamily ATP-dependent carboligase
VPSAEETPRVFVDAIARAAAELKVDAVLPGTEASLIAVSRWRDSMPCAVGAPPPDIVELATNKEMVLSIARAAGLATPTSIVGLPAELVGRVSEFRYPAILKPLRTRLQVGGERLAYYKARRIADAQEMATALEGLPAVDWVVQPYIEGRLGAIAGVAWEGQIVCAVHQLSRRIWPPHVGYSSYAETVPPEVDLESRVARVIEEIGWSGLFQAQLMRPRDGRPVLIDFNPRPYGSLALAVAAGANLPAVWASLVLGRRPPVVGYQPGVRYRLEHNDVRAIMKSLCERDLRAFSALWPQPRTAHAVFSLRDPGPLLTTAEKLVAMRRRNAG